MDLRWQDVARRPREHSPLLLCLVLHITRQLIILSCTLWGFVRYLSTGRTPHFSINCNCGDTEETCLFVLAGSCTFSSPSGPGIRHTNYIIVNGEL